MKKGRKKAVNMSETSEVLQGLLIRVPTVL
jgi:hypothetical protein